MKWLLFSTTDEDEDGSTSQEQMVTRNGDDEFNLEEYDNEEGILDVIFGNIDC